jgi:hypothetical protein
LVGGGRMDVPRGMKCFLFVGAVPAVLESLVDMVGWLLMGMTGSVDCGNVVCLIGLNSSTTTDGSESERVVE